MTITQADIKVLEQEIKDMNNTLDNDMKSLLDASMWVRKDLNEIRIMESKLKELTSF